MIDEGDLLAAGWILDAQYEGNLKWQDSISLAYYTYHDARVIEWDRRMHAKLPITPEHMAALRAAIGLWNYGAGDYHGTPLATVPDKLRELLAILEGET